MKKTILLSSVAVMSAVATFAQTRAPQSFNYQGAARKPDGTPLAETPISLRLSIVKDVPNGTVEYYEVRKVTTNALGLYSVSVGSGINEEGNVLEATGGQVAFSQIAWGASAKYFRVEVDPNAGNNFALAGVAPIAAVPYALYSERGGTSAFNYWASLPENAGKKEADFIAYLKQQAVSDVVNTAKNLTATDVDGILSVTGGDGAVLKAAEIKLNKAAFDKAARQAAIDGLNGKDGGDGTGKALIDAVTNVVKNGIDGTNGQDGALTETVKNTVNNLITDGKINGKDATVNNAGTNADGSILAFNAGNQAALKDLQLILDKSALNNETKQSIIDGLNGLNGTNGVNGIDGKLQDAINNAITNGLNGVAGTNGSNGADGVNTKLVETITKVIQEAVNGDGIKGKALTTDYAAGAPEANKFLAVTGNGADALLKDAQLAIDPAKFNQAVSDAITGANGANGAAGANGTNGSAGVGKDLGKITGDANVLDIVAVNGGQKSVLSETALGIDKAGFDKAAKQSVIDGLNGQNGQNGTDGVNGELQDAINKAVANGLNGLGGTAGANGADGTNGTDGANTIIKEAIEKVVAAGADKSLEFGAPNAAPTGAADKADATSGTITPATTPDGKAQIQLNAAGEQAKGVVSNEDIKNAVAAGLNAANTEPAGTNAGDPAVNQALNDAVNNAIKNGKDADGNSFAKKLTTESFITVSKEDNKALLEDLTVGVDQNKLNQGVAETLNKGLTNADGTPVDPASNPLADAVKDAVKNGILNGKDGAAGANGKDGELTNAIETIIKESAGTNFQFADATNAVPTADAAGKLGTVTPGVDGAAATINLAKASETLPGVSSLADVKDAVATGILNGANGQPGTNGVDGKLADAVKDAIINGATNGKDGAPGADGKDGELRDALTTIVKEEAGKNFVLAPAGTAPTGTADKADAPTGTVTPGDATNPATITINKAGENAPGVVSNQDIKNVIASAATDANVGEDFKTANANGDGTEANILQIGATNTNTTAAAAALKEIDLQINKGALNKNTTDALKATDGTNGANALQDAVKDVITNAIVNGKDGAAGADGVDGKLADAVTNIIKETAPANFTFGQAAPAKADGTGGTITAGDGTTPATIQLAKAGATTPGVVSQQDIKDVIAGTNGAGDGIGKTLSTAGIAKITAGDAVGATLKDVTVSVTAEDVVKSVADAFTAGSEPLKGALDGANAALIKDPASETAKALGAAAKDPANPLNDGIDAANAAFVKDPASETSKGLVDALTPNGASANPNLQDAIKDLTAAGAADVLTVGAAGAAPSGTTDAATTPVGTVTPGTNGAPATLTINQAGDKAPGVIAKDDIKTAIADALTGPAGADGSANDKLQDAVKGALNDNIAAVAPATTSSPNGLVVGKDADGKTTLQLTPADATNPGIITAGPQTIGGDKTFAGSTTLGSETAPATTTTINGNVALGAEAAKDIKDAIASNGSALKTESFITAATAENAQKALLNEVTLSVDNAKLNQAVADQVKAPAFDADGNPATAAANPLADAIKQLTAGTAGQAASAVQDVKVAGDGAAAITATKDATTNVVTLDVKKATDTTPGVVSLTDVRNAVAGDAAGANRLDDGNITKTAGADNILTINGGTNATFANVDLGVTKAAVQGAVAEGLASPTGNDALKNALAQANADALNAEPANAQQQAFQDAVNNNAADGIKDVLAGAGTTADKALTDAVKAAAKDGLSDGDLLAVGAPGAAPTGTADVNTAPVGTITPATATTPATLTLNAAGENAKGVVSNQDIKDVIAGTNGEAGIGKALSSTDIDVVGGEKAVLNATTLTIKTGAITSDKILDGTITGTDVAPNTLTGGNIQDGTVTGADLADKTVTPDKLATPAGTPAGQVLTTNADGTVSYAAPTASAANITNKKDITSTDLTVTDGTGSVVSAANVVLNIKNDAITADKIAANAVGTSELATDAVTADKIADNAVNSANIIDGTVTSADLADKTIVAGDIADKTITGAQIADKTISPDKLQATAAEAGKVPVVGADGTVTWAAPKTAATDVTGAQAIASAANTVTVSGGDAAALKAVNLEVNQANLNLAQIGGKLPVAKIDGAGGAAGQVPMRDAAGNVTWQTPSTANLGGGADVTAGSNKVTLGGTPTGAALKAFSVDVNEANINIANLSGKLPVTSLAATAGDQGKVPTVDNAGNVSLQTPVIPASNVSGGKTLTTDGVIVIGNATDNTVTKPSSLLLDTKISIRDGGINTAQLADNAVNSAKIADGTITGADVANNTITGGNILDGTVTSADIADKTITGGDVADKTITAANLVAPIGATQGQVLTTNADGTVSYKTPTTNTADITNAQDLTVSGLAKITSGTGTGATLKAVTVGVSDADVQGSIVKGLGTDANANTALKAAVKANAPAITAASPANGVTVTKDATTGDYTIGAAKATETTAGTVTLADVKTAAAAGTTNELSLGGAAPNTPTTLTSNVNGVAKTVDLGTLEPWRLAGTSYATAGTTESQNIARSGNITVGASRVFPAKINAFANDASTTNKVASALHVENLSAAYEQDRGVKITMAASGSTQYTDLITYISGGAGTSNTTAFAVRNTNSGKEYFTVETGTQNAFEGNVGIGTKDDSADPRPRQKLDVNGNVRVRGLFDGTNATNYPSVVVAADNGVLGKRTISDLVSASGQALTSSDITVTNGTKAVLTATTLAIKDGAITSAKIADGTVTSADIADKTIAAADIADKTITGAQIADKTITPDKLTTGGAPAGTVPVANADGTVTYQPATQLVQFGQQKFVATAAQTSFAVTGAPADYNKVFVFRNGVKLVANEDYTVTAGQVTLVPTAFVGGAAAAGDVIEVQFAK